MNTLLRAGMWFITAVEITVGVVATLTPRWFYDNVPWVDLAPPFAEHLMRDYGAMNLALGLVTAVAFTMDRVMVRTSLAAYLLFAVPHLIFPRHPSRALHGLASRRRNDGADHRRAAAASAVGPDVASSLAETAHRSHVTNSRSPSSLEGSLARAARAILGCPSIPLTAEG